MDVIIHWGVLRRLREDVGANPVVLICAILFDLVALGAFLVMKAMSDPAIIVISATGIIAIFVFEKFYLSRRREKRETHETGHQE